MSAMQGNEARADVGVVRRALAPDGPAEGALDRLSAALDAAERERDEARRLLLTDPDGLRKDALISLGLSKVWAEDDETSHALLDRLGAKRYDADGELSIVERLDAITPTPSGKPGPEQPPPTDRQRFVVEQARRITAEARMASMEAALREIVNMLGPEVPTHGCEGCEAEMAEALTTARAALASLAGETATAESLDREVKMAMAKAGEAESNLWAARLKVLEREREEKAAPATTLSDTEQRLDRIEQAITTMVWWLVDAQTGFNERDARGIVDILSPAAVSSRSDEEATT